MMNAVRLEKPDTVFFLGDGDGDIAELEAKFPELTVYAVRGNCDFRSNRESSMLVTADGVRIYMTHGHLSDVKYDSRLEMLTSQALEAEAQIALFGHTHDQHLSENRGVMLLNPGSVGRGYYPSYAVLNIKDGFYNADLKAI
jgi:putative phosphoesterase